MANCIENKECLMLSCGVFFSYHCLKSGQVDIVFIPLFKKADSLHKLRMHLKKVLHSLSLSNDFDASGK